MRTQISKQTISLFRYFLIGIVNRRLAVLILALLVIGALLRGFVAELAIINGADIANAALADFLRYSFVLVTILLVVTNIVDDFESRQFERLLAMPISRWQYIVAQILVITIIATLLSLPILLMLMVSAPFAIAVYWAAALWLEIFLVGLLALLTALSLEKTPLAILLAVAIYLLAKLSTIIDQMLVYSIHNSDDSISSQMTDTIFQAIQYVLPRLEAFAQNDLFFNNTGLAQALIHQAETVAIYSCFLLLVVLIDFYRKEFNL